jgi:hypothetical protein
MKTFRCVCGNTLHFENSLCLNCGRAAGFLPDRGEVAALAPVGISGTVPGPSGAAVAVPGDAAAVAIARLVTPASGGGTYRLCSNWTQQDVCNWLVPSDDPNFLCRSCRLNRIIPDLSKPGNRRLWYRIEVAKRRLLYTLFALGLPLEGRDVDPQRGLAFEFLADPAPPLEFADPAGSHRHIMTGHQKGLITINLAEADDPARESMRERMHELYRTLLGHFRHESGHYYWERLVAGTQWLEPFRKLFGDERTDYAQSLRRHYQGGENAAWEAGHISAYAAAHPWEDWAETWAHYLHMVDTLETAHDFGLRIDGRPVATPKRRGGPVGAFEALRDDWSHVAATLNALNRSMGLSDAYPFVLEGKAVDKLAFVHRVIAAR